MNARTRPALVVCVVGAVGPGGSTLPGRLRDELDAPLAGSAALRAGTAERELAIVDAPGPRELLGSLVADPAGAAAALLVVDASTGPGPQARRDLGLLRVAGVRDLLVAVDDMDRAQWSEARFTQVRHAVAAAIAGHGLAARAIVPVSARDGSNLRARAAAAWWRGPTLVEALEALPGPAGAGPLRMPVADVVGRGAPAAVSGRILSGALAVGDDVLVLPADRRTRVVAFAGGTSVPASASAGDDVSVLLADPVAVERGDLVCAPGAPAKLTAVFDADLAWLGDGDLAAGRRVVVRIGARDVGARVATVHHALGEEDFARRAASAVDEGGFARVTLRCDAAVAVDDAAASPATGRFALVDGGLVVGAGLIDASGYPDQRRARPVSTNLVPVHHQIGAGERAARAGHRGAVVWLTGLSGAGKSTLALALERRLFDRGWGVYTLDGDNVRGGLNADLGFSPADRQENLRRVGEVAALFADAGLVCVTAFISPYRDERARARAAAGRHPFLEVWLKTSLDECERRDPKGFYRRARAGEIRGFTGIDSPYEPPESADLVLDTQALSVASATDALAAFVFARCADDGAR